MHPQGHWYGSPKITVVSVSNSVETAHQLRTDAPGLTTVKLTVICNEFELIRVAWKTGEVTNASGNWILLYPRESYSECEIRPGSPGSPATLYLHAPDAAASVKVAVIEWL